VPENQEREKMGTKQESKERKEHYGEGHGFVKSSALGPPAQLQKGSGKLCVSTQSL